MKLQFRDDVSIIIVSMQKVKVFLQSMVHALLPRRLPYHAFSKKSPVFALWYLVGILTITYFFFLMAFWVIYNPLNTFSQMMNSIRNAIQTTSPSLTVTIANGKMKSNYDRPYLWWANIGNKKVLAMVVDDSASAQKIQQYQSLTLLTPGEFVVRTPQKSFITFAFPQQNRYVITKTTAIVWYDQLFRWYKIGIMTVSILLLTAFPILYICTYMLTTVIVSFAVFLFYRFKREHISFRLIFHLSSFAITAPLLIYLILCLLFPVFLALPGVFLILDFFFVIAAVHQVNFDNRKERQQKTIHDKR